MKSSEFDDNDDFDLSVLALDDAGEGYLRQLLVGNKRVRLGILGGTFDPVHNGHLYCAQAALEQAQLDMVLFMPAGLPVFKLNKAVTQGVHRLEMCRRAAAAHARFATSSIELNREGKTFTADTLRAMRAALPERVQFFFIMGADAANSFPMWREHDVVAKLATLIVFASANHPVLPERQSMLCEQGVRVEYVQADPPDISSTQIREMVRKGQQAGALMPPTVYDYLCEKCLYSAVDE